MRCMICSMDISSEKTAVGMADMAAARMATFMAKAVLPMDGRPATMMRSEGWRPAVISSNW